MRTTITTTNIASLPTSLLLVLLIAASCGHRPAPVAIERLDIAASGLRPDTVTAAYAPALGLLGRMQGITSADSALVAYRSSAAQRVFAPDIARRLGSLDSVESELGLLKERLAQAEIGVRFPARIYGVATAYNQSVVTADTILLLGLNHYLGADYEGYASFEPYRRRLKTPDRIPVDIAEALIASAHPYRPADAPTTLSRLLYEGALLEAMSRAMPDADDARLLGYTPQELRWATDNEARVWQTMVGADMIFSIDPSVADRLLLPAPATTAVNAAAPGRIGRYIGLKIVRAYLTQSPETTVDHMLSPVFYNDPQTLQKALYTP